MAYGVLFFFRSGLVYQLRTLFFFVRNTRLSNEYFLAPAHPSIVFFSDSFFSVFVLLFFSFFCFFMFLLFLLFCLCRSFIVLLMSLSYLPFF